MKINLGYIGSGLAGFRSPVSAIMLLGSGLPPSRRRIRLRPPGFAGQVGAASWLLASSLWLLGGCSLPIPSAQPDLTRYFILQAPVRPAGEAEQGSYPVIRLKSVDVPAYLDERSLAVRRGANEIRYLKTARWAEPLEQDLARNVRLGLASIPGLVVLSRYDTAGKWDYDLTVRVAACEGTEDRTVRFSADWVLEPTLNSSLPRKAGTFTGRDLAWDGTAPESLVAALSQGVTQLCDALAEALKAPR